MKKEYELLDRALKDCLELDTKIRSLYLRFAAEDNSPEMDAFWRDAADDEAAHVDFWRRAAAIPPELRPQPPPDAAELAGRIGQLKVQVNGLLSDFKGWRQPGAEINMACTAELYFYDPVFMELFRLFEFVAPETVHGYSTHVGKFIAEARRFSGSEAGTPVAFLGDIMEKMNRLDAMLYRESTTDSLTGLLNRRGFDDSVRRANTETGDPAKTDAMLMLDLDGFKKANDSFGHDTGDEILRRTAHALQKSLRCSDAMCRRGGDEFAIFCRNITPEAADQLCERLVKAVAAVRVSGKAGVTVSIGAAIGRPDESPEKMLAAADGQLLAAKSSGGNCWKLGIYP